MTTAERWQKAQEYERSHWARASEEIGDGDQAEGLEWYGWRADRLHDMLSLRLGERLPQPLDILEVGSGPVGTISFMRGASRRALDPLNDFYEESPDLVRWRDPEVQYLAGCGEELPYEDGQFSLVVIDNVIDHTQSPSQVMKECHRVLRPDGILYLSVNVRTAWGLRVRRLMEVFQIDKGHPHSYDEGLARKLLREGGFSIVHEEVQDRDQARQEEQGQGHLRSRIKVVLGVYDILFEMIAQKS